MGDVVGKVTAFITRVHGGRKELLLFRHPNAGVQIPAGTVEEGESFEAAVVREAFEETGLKDLRIVKHLGCYGSDVGEDQRIMNRETTVYWEPDLNSLPYKKKLGRAWVCDYGGMRDGFTHLTYFEYDRWPDPRAIDFVITGWVPDECVATRQDRHCFELECLEETSESWELPGDQGHMFRPFWIPLVPRPYVVPPQSRWLEFVYEELRGSEQ